MRHELPDSLHALAELQCGILTASQAVAGGISRNVITSRLRQGRWQRMHAGVYAVFSGEPPQEAVLWAAVLSAGPGAMLSYRSVAELDGLADSVSPVITRTSPASSTSAPASTTRHLAGQHRLGSRDQGA